MIELSCPVCQHLLHTDAEARVLCCDNGHSFDRARQGYWNLLLAQRKKSKDPGDNSEMVQARRRFLDTGHYQPISDLLNRTLIGALADNPAPNVLDLGCGEGYYTARMAEALNDAGCNADLAGLDISKHAVRAACQRNRNLHWLVATGAAIPVAESSLDAVTLVFSRLMCEPMARVLKPGASLLVVWPGPEHLLELRELIYDEVRQHDSDPAAELAAAFEQVEQHPLHFNFAVRSQAELNDLLAMTPHGQRIGSAARERLQALERLECRADIRISHFRRH